MEEELEARLQKSAKHLTDVALNFLLDLSPSDLPEEEFQSLSGILNQHGVIALSRQLRSALASATSAVFRYQRQSVWDLIDNIGFWEDARPGRWPYTTVTDSYRYLQWVEEFAICNFWYIHIDQAYCNAYLPSGLPWCLLDASVEPEVT